MPMKALPMNKNGHAQDCKCLTCKPEEEEIGPFGQWDEFRDFVDGMCDLFKPKNAYIYPTFACLEFNWSTDRVRMENYLDDRSADRYTGIHFSSDDKYWLVVIDITEENVTGKETDDDKSVQG